MLLDNGYCPVLTIPIADENGFAINSENDDIIVQLAQALEIESVVQLIEAPGFLDDPERREQPGGAHEPDRIARA